MGDRSSLSPASSAVIEQAVTNMVTLVSGGTRQIRCGQKLAKKLLLHGPIQTAGGTVRADRAKHLGAGIYCVVFSPCNASVD